MISRPVSCERHPVFKEAMEENSVTLSPHKDNNDIRVVTKAADVAKEGLLLTRAVDQQRQVQTSVLADAGERVAVRLSNFAAQDNIRPESVHNNPYHPEPCDSINNNSGNQSRATVRRPGSGNVQHRRLNGGGSRPNRSKNASSRGSRLNAPKIVAKQRKEQELQIQLSQQRNFIQLAGISTRELGHPADDVVRCFCGDTAEDGLMVQCEQCQSWQHSHCLEYEMDNLPSSYICIFCEHLPHLMYNLRYSARDHATCTQQLVNCDSELYAVPRSVQYDKSASVSSKLNSCESVTAIVAPSSSSSSPPQFTAGLNSKYSATTFHGSNFAPSSPPPPPALPYSDSISQHSMSTSSTSSLLEVPLTGSQQYNRFATSGNPQQQQQPHKTQTSCDLDTVDGLNKFNLEIQTFMKEISVMVDYYKKKFAEINLNAFDPTKMPWLPTTSSSLNRSVRMQNAAAGKAHSIVSASPSSSNNSSSGISDGKMPLIAKSCMPGPQLVNGDCYDGRKTYVKDKLYSRPSRWTAHAGNGALTKATSEGLKNLHRNLAALGIETGYKVDNHRLLHYANKLMPSSPSSHNACSHTQYGAAAVQPSLLNYHESSWPPLHFAQERLKLLTILREVDEDEQADELTKCLNAVNKLSAFSRHVHQRTVEMRERFYSHNQQYLLQSTVLDNNKSVGVGSHIHTAVKKLRNMEGACKNLTRFHALSASAAAAAASVPVARPTSATSAALSAIPTEANNNNIHRVPLPVFEPSNIMPVDHRQQQHVLHNGDVSRNIFASHPSAIKLRGFSPALATHPTAVVQPPSLVLSSPVTLSPPSMPPATILRPSLMPLSLPLPAVISSTSNHTHSKLNNNNRTLCSTSDEKTLSASSTPPPPVLTLETTTQQSVADDAAELHTSPASIPIVVPRVEKGAPWTLGSSVISVLALDKSVPAAIAVIGGGKNMHATTTVSAADGVKRRRPRKRHRSPSPTTAMMLELYEAGGFSYAVNDMSRTLMMDLSMNDVANDFSEADVATEETQGTSCSSSSNNNNSVGTKRFKAMRTWYEHRKQELFFNTQLRRPGNSDNNNNNNKS